MNTYVHCDTFRLISYEPNLGAGTQFCPFPGPRQLPYSTVQYTIKCYENNEEVARFTCKLYFFFKFRTNFRFSWLNFAKFRDIIRNFLFQNVVNFYRKNNSKKRTKFSEAYYFFFFMQNDNPIIVVAVLYGVWFEGAGLLLLLRHRVHEGRSIQ